jgi:hypothetical protein
MGQRSELQFAAGAGRERGIRSAAKVRTCG